MHLAAVFLDNSRFGQSLPCVVAALDIDGRTHLLDEGFRRRLIEKHDIINSGERPRDRCTIKLRVDGARLALQTAHGSVGVEAEHEAIAQSARLFQVTHMPRVQDVEAAVREDDALPRLAQDGAKALDFFLRYQHGRSPPCNHPAESSRTFFKSSSALTVAVPNFRTATPDAMFDSCAAAKGAAPPASARMKVATHVSPAPETS